MLRTSIITHSIRTIEYLYSRVFVLYSLSTVEIILTAPGKTPLTAIIARHPFQSLAKQKKVLILCRKTMQRRGKDISRMANRPSTTNPNIEY